jgi:hypothetical protein
VRTDPGNDRNSPSIERWRHALSSAGADASAWIVGWVCWRWWLGGGPATPGSLAELPELTRGEKVKLNLVQDDSRILHGAGKFDAPQFLSVFIEYSDGFAFPGDEATLGARGFDQKCEAPGRCLIGRAHVGSLDNVVRLRLPAELVKWGPSTGRTPPQ